MKNFNMKYYRKFFIDYKAKLVINLLLSNNVNESRKYGICGQVAYNNYIKHLFLNCNFL